MGPVMSSLPVRQTPDSASVDGHSSFPLRERSCPMGSGCNVCSQVSPAGYLLLSVVSAKGCQHDAVRKGSGETIYECVVRQMTTNWDAYVFTTSTVPATGPRGARATLLPAQRLVIPPLSKPIEICLEGHGGIFCATEPSGHTPEAAQRFAL